MDEDSARLHELYSGYTRSAFRLELLPVYRVPGEEESWKQFVSGEYFLADEQYAQELSTHKRVLERGGPMSRIHVVEDLVPYIQFEIEWGYLYSASVGEQIYLMHVDKYKSLVHRDFVDFFLFDDEIVVKMLYDDEYRFIGVKFFEDEETVQEHITVRNALLPHAVHLRDFLSALRQTTIPWPESLK